MSDLAEDMHYIHTGPWPVFVGFTTSEKAFAAEMKRLGVDENIQFSAHSRAGATTHYLVKDRHLCCIITIEPYSRRVSREVYAALVAHEAMHVVQEMQRELNKGKSLGDEAEAYMIQQIVQEILRIAWGSNMVRRTEPTDG